MSPQCSTHGLPFAFQGARSTEHAGAEYFVGKVGIRTRSSSPISCYKPPLWLPHRPAVPSRAPAPPATSGCGAVTAICATRHIDLRCCHRHLHQPPHRPAVPSRPSAPPARSTCGAVAFTCASRHFDLRSCHLHLHSSPLGSEPPSKPIPPSLLLALRP